MSSKENGSCSKNHQVSDMVSGFYNELSAKGEFKTRVNAENLSTSINEVIDQLSPETMKRYYGSGFLFPEDLAGARVLDLGCGSGSFVFILSKLVGPNGFVVGVDITSGLIESAKQESEYHWKKWGYEKANFEFYSENIERVTDLGLDQFDIVVSNCVFCLCPNKSKVFEQAYSMLKPNGMFLLGDVYAEFRQPDELKKDPKLWCLGTTGSMTWEELGQVTSTIGFTPPSLLSCGPACIKNEEIKKTLQNCRYACCELRMFKLGPDVEKKAASSVGYLGTLRDSADSFKWDMDLRFKKGESVTVDSDLATILNATSFKRHFSFAEATQDAGTKKTQNPFNYLKTLEAAGNLPTARYSVE